MGGIHNKIKKMKAHKVTYDPSLGPETRLMLAKSVNARFKGQELVEFAIVLPLLLIIDTMSFIKSGLVFGECLSVLMIIT